MKRRFNPSAAQLAMLGGLGGLLCATAFVIPTLFHAQFTATGYLLRAAYLFPPLLLGAPILFFSLRRLKCGLQQGRWPQQQIDSLRRITQSASWQGVIFACFAIYVLCAIKSLESHGWLACLRQVAFVLAYTLGALLHVTRRKDYFDPSHLGSDWRNAAPLHSSHWGER